MRRSTVGLAAGALLAVSIQPAASAAVSEAVASGGRGAVVRTAGASAASAPATTVTLPTGDRVRVTGTVARPDIRLERPARTTSTRAATVGAAAVLSAAGHTYVVPAAAQRYVGRGLSISLFDVTALAARGSDGAPLVLAARFAPTYRSLPAGLTRRSPTEVVVTDPAAFGAALTRSRIAGDGPGTTSSVLRGLTLALPGSPVAADGELTGHPRGRLYTVTVNGVDRRGRKDTGDIGVLDNVDDTSRFIAAQSFFRGTFSFSVPRGHYSVQSFIATTLPGGGPSYTLATEPEFLVDRDTVVTLDARDGVRFSVSTPRPSSPVHAELNLQREAAAGLPFTDSLVTFDDTPLYATPTDPVSVGRLFFYPAMRLGDADGSIDTYLYDVEFPFRQRIPDDLHLTVAAADQATVRSAYASVVPRRTEQESRMGALPWQTVFVGAIDNLVAPTRRTEYVTARPGLLWHQEVDLDPDVGNGRTLAPAASYAPGEHETHVWNTQPSGSGPEQERDSGQACPLCRGGDTLSVALFPNVDRADDIMLADATTTETLTLYQDGVDVGEAAGGFATFPMSADPASYRLVYDVARTAPWWPTSTAVSTAWSFDSQEQPPGHLPPGWTCGGKSVLDDGCSLEHLLLVHYDTSAGLDGVVPAGTVAHVVVDVSPQRGLHPDPLASLTGHVSFDGGTSWRHVDAVRRSATSYRLSYRQPALADTDGFAALRVVATAASGSRVAQTVTRAYPLAPLPPARDPGHVDPATAEPLSCAAPAPAPRTQCLAVLGPSARGDGAEPVGYAPSDIRRAYALPAHPTSRATVAVVTPYDDPNAAADLSTYRTQFGLSRCTPASGCLTTVNQLGQPAPLPPPSPDWSVQTSQALDAVSATCPSCRILLIEADSASLQDLAPAAMTAGRLGADVISNGYGTTGEFSGEQVFERRYRTLDVPFVVAAGDYGYGNGAPLIGSISYPSASRSAVAVGGTTLLPAGNDRGFTETAWASTTSGCSAYIAKPAWQHDRLCAKRTTADVAADGDPATGLAVYDTYGYDGWIQVGGTSLAAALVAGVFGLNPDAGPAHAAAGLYRPRASLFDVTEGANGECKATYLCTAEVGYDGPSGIGTPNGDSAF